MVEYLSSLHGALFKLTVLFFIVQTCSGYDLFSCLHLKSLCRRIPECKLHLRHLESKCGISLQRCESSQISDCVHCVRSIKDILGVFNGTCWCYENLGKVRECEHFRSKIWSHPCEKRLTDFEIHNQLNLHAFDPEPLINPLLLTDDSSEIKKPINKRTTRSPMANEIEQWRHQLADALPANRPIQARATCQSALYDVCLKHISCRELWKIFRESCFVDAQNKCKMTNKDNCWQAFEGISWTGLGNCTCTDRNSDCHWIRLQTNYNKCIYELSVLGYTSRFDTSTYIQQYQTHDRSRQADPPTTTALTTTTTTTTTTRAPPTTEIPTTRRPQHYYPDPQMYEKQRAHDLQRRQELELIRQERRRNEEERKRLDEERRILNEKQRIQLAEEQALRSRQSQNQRAHQNNNHNSNNNKYSSSSNNRNSGLYPANIRVDLRTTDKLYTTQDTVITTLPKPPTDYYGYNSSPQATPKPLDTTTTSTTSTTSTTTTTTTSTPSTTTEETIKATISSETFYKNFKIKVKESTCQTAYKKCEMSETCKWHLSEVKMRCSSESTCVRMQCASALRRFSRYVNREIAEAVTFCQCAENDLECSKNQDMIRPACMDVIPATEVKKTCTDVFKNCASDAHCSRNLPKYTSYCSVDDAGACTATDFKKCRDAILSIRGTHFEVACYCSSEDQDCLKKQKMIIPNNPCIENAVSQYVQDNQEEYPTTTTEKVDVIVETTATPVETSDMTSEEVPMAVKILETSTEKSSNESSAELLSNIFDNQTVADPFVKTTTQKAKKKNLHTYPTDAYVTHAPPQEGGCLARNIDGGWITHYKDSVVRQYSDWSGRCSLWCECSPKEVLNCHKLPCLDDGFCTTDQTKIAFGEKLYIEGRGACICHSGHFICDTPDDLPEELEPGLYISIGFSIQELKMFKEKIPKNFTEKSGLVSPDASIAKDIVSRLQYALERVMPKDTLCRIIILEDLSKDENAVLQLQWFGIDVYTNDTKPAWQVGKMEKICAKYVKQLEYMFLLEKSGRYQLILSSVKQLTVFDLLDGLPPVSAAISSHDSASVIISFIPLISFLLLSSTMF